MPEYAISIPQVKYSATHTYLVHYSIDNMAENEYIVSALVSPEDGDKTIFRETSTGTLTTTLVAKKGTAYTTIKTLSTITYRYSTDHPTLTTENIALNINSFLATEKLKSLGQERFGLEIRPSNWLNNMYPQGAYAWQYIITTAYAPLLSIEESAYGTVYIEYVDYTHRYGNVYVLPHVRVELYATPTSGYRLTGWESSQVEVSEYNDFWMPDFDVTITPIFEQYIFNVSVAQAQNGYAIADKSTAEIGETVTLTPTPNANYRFLQWETSPEITITNNTFVMPNSNVTITPVFEQYIFDISIAQGQNGYAISDKNTAEIGETVTLTPMPNTHYRFLRWETSPEVTITNNTFVMPNSNVTITPVFIEKDAGYYNGSSYLQCVPMYYDGSNWIECEWRYHDGTNWLNADST